MAKPNDNWLMDMLDKLNQQSFVVPNLKEFHTAILDRLISDAEGQKWECLRILLKQRPCTDDNLPNCIGCQVNAVLQEMIDKWRLMRDGT